MNDTPTDPPSQPTDVPPTWRIVDANTGEAVDLKALEDDTTKGLSSEAEDAQDRFTWYLDDLDAALDDGAPPETISELYQYVRAALDIVIDLVHGAEADEFFAIENMLYACVWDLLDRFQWKLPKTAAVHQAIAEQLVAYLLDACADCLNRDMVCHHPENVMLLVDGVVIPNFRVDLQSRVVRPSRHPATKCESCRG